jgi:RND family efflux transporter MFP subunit
MSSTPPDLSRLRIERPTTAPVPGRSRRVLLFVLPAVLVAVVAGLMLTRPRPLVVRTVAVQTTGGAGALAGEGISANGYVVARTKASVSAKIAGRLEYLGANEGTRVRRGEVIARIESPGYVAAVAQARAEIARIQVELAQARRDLERARTLRQQNVISDVEVESASTRVESLQAQLGSARAQSQIADVNLENTRVRAPFDGTVLRKDAEVGEIVAPASAGGGLTRTAIVTMADLGTLEVEVDVNEAYIAQIQGDQEARITLDAYPDTSFRGRVRQVVPTADRQKATVQVKVSILDRDARILPEMGAKVVFVSSSDAQPVATARRRVMVPATSVVGGNRVWIVNDEKVSARTVEVGATQGEQVEIRQGLEGGESVVVAPPPQLKEGARVRVARG